MITTADAVKNVTSDFDTTAPTTLGGHRKTGSRAGGADGQEPAVGVHSMRCPDYWPKGPWYLGDQSVGPTEFRLKETHVRGKPNAHRTSLRETNPVEIGEKTGGRFHSVIADGKIRSVTAGDYWTCELPPESAMYRTLIGYIGGAAHDHPYTTKRFEAARLATDGDVKASTFLKFANPSLPIPTFSDGSYKISRIRVIYCPTRWDKYVAFRTDYAANRAQGGPNTILQNITWARPPADPHNVGFQFPVIDSTLGECFLFHGTGAETIKLISRFGFGPEYCKYRSSVFSGFGSLGQGSYLADNLAKSATYCDCPGCGGNGPCNCVDRNGEPLERVAIIARGVIPDESETHTGRQWKRKFAHQHMNLKEEDEREHQRPFVSDGKGGQKPKAITGNELQGPPMILGLNSDRRFVRKWPNNVFLARNKDMVYPELIVYFQWPRDPALLS